MTIVANAGAVRDVPVPEEWAVVDIALEVRAFSAA